MKLSQEEKAARRAAFRNMSGAQKLEYIFGYYKAPILLGLLVLMIAGSVLVRAARQKEPVLYLALANVAVGEDMETALGSGFLEASGADARRQEVYLYRDLYLSDEADVLNHEYAYASRMKLMGAIQARKLDALIMNREAYDLLSASGYLLDLSALLSEADPDLAETLAAEIRTNAVVLEDNGIAYQLGEAEEHRVVTEDAANGAELTKLPLFQAASFGEPLYFGVVANSPRSAAAVTYLRYLVQAAG